MKKYLYLYSSQELSEELFLLQSQNSVTEDMIDLDFMNSLFPVLSIPISCPYKLLFIMLLELVIQIIINKETIYNILGYILTLTGFLINEILKIMITYREKNHCINGMDSK